MLIDLHTHTRPLSWDSFLSADELIERSRAAGLDGIVLSEHDFFWDGAQVRRLARRHDFLVMAGAEINTNEGHMLVYGIDKYIYGMHRSGELADRLDEAGGVMIAAHPYRRQMPWRIRDDGQYQEALARASRNAAYRRCVALEKINGRGKLHENDFSARLCEQMGMPGTAGSDAHARSDIGRCATFFERRIESIHDLIEELKAGRFEAVDLVTAPAG